MHRRNTTYNAKISKIVLTVQPYLILRIDIPKHNNFPFQKIEVDESAKKPENEDIGEDDLVQSARRLEEVCRLSPNQNGV